MAAATIRLGKISSINYTAGKARVVYEDRDDSVTSELPFLALQYNIPKVDDLVVVACFSNGSYSDRCIIQRTHHMRVAQASSGRR